MKYRIAQYETLIGNKPVVCVQRKLLWLWVTIKEYADSDNGYNIRCAEELIEKLNEEV